MKLNGQRNADQTTEQTRAMERFFQKICNEKSEMILFLLAENKVLRMQLEQLQNRNQQGKCSTNESQDLNDFEKRFFCL